jgi:hypothetical protein
MANIDVSAFGTPSAISPFSQQQLFALLSTLASARDAAQGTALCQLIVDGSLPWVVVPRADGGSWLHLAQSAPVQQFADCLLLTAA